MVKLAVNSQGGKVFNHRKCSRQDVIPLCVVWRRNWYLHLQNWHINSLQVWVILIVVLAIQIYLLWNWMQCRCQEVAFCKIDGLCCSFFWRNISKTSNDENTIMICVNWSFSKNKILNKIQKSILEQLFMNNSSKIYLLLFLLILPR